MPGNGEILPPFEYFFKVISSRTMESKKLMLPRKFAAVFKDKLPDVAMLKLPNGRVWSVGMTRERGNRNRVWLDSGFGDFLRHHSIFQGHLLMFKYDGDGPGFNVVIFDTTACEVVFPEAEHQPPPSQEDDSIDDEDEDSEFNGEDDDDEEEEESESDSDESFSLGSPNFRRNSRSTNGRGNQAVSGNRRGGGRDASGPRRRATQPDAGTGRGRGVAPGNGGASGSRERRQVLGGEGRGLLTRLAASSIITSTKFWTSLNKMSERSKRALEEAIRCNNRNYPSAMMVMKDYNIHPGFMYLPTAFAEMYFPRDAEEVTLRAYEEKRGFLYEGQVKSSRDDRNVLFFRGWPLFCKMSGLDEGDVCLLELVDEETKVFNVHIFKG